MDSIPQRSEIFWNRIDPTPFHVKKNAQQTFFESKLSAPHPPSPSFQLLAPQSGALRINAFRDFQPNPTHPLIAFEHLSLYTVF